MYVSVYDVGLFILFALALAVGGYLMCCFAGNRSCGKTTQ